METGVIIAVYIVQINHRLFVQGQKSFSTSCSCSASQDTTIELPLDMLTSSPFLAVRCLCPVHLS